MTNGLGYTGNICASCGGSRMVRTGACECCQDCGSSSGCSRAKNALASIAAHAIGGIIAVLMLSACAAPNADQGQGQGSSSTPTFVFAPVLNFGAVTGGSKGADSTSTTAPTSAPAATSANDATQKADAKADVTATVPAGGLSLTKPEAPKPEPKPGE